MFVQELENRVLFAAAVAPRVTSVVADNRGEVLINLTPGVSLDPTSVNKGSALIYTAGKDGKLGTSDDVRLSESVSYSSSANRITLRAKVKAGTGYRVRLIASRIKAAKTSALLDGEFTGAFPSGNGTAGGDFNLQTKNDKSNRPTVRMSTSRGLVTLSLFADKAPKTVAAFLGRANAGLYDNLFVTRSLDGTLVQAGSLRIDDLNKVIENPIGEGAVPESTGLNNVTGTISMDRLKLNTGLEGTSFFFNLKNNTNFDSTSKRYTVFGQASGASSLAVLDAINKLSTVDLTQQGYFYTLTDTTRVPVNDAAPAQASFNPTRDAIIIRRTAVVMKIGRI